MTPPAAVWDVEQQAREMWDLYCLKVSYGRMGRPDDWQEKLRTEIFGGALTLARAPAPSAEAMREAAATLLDQHRAVIQQATKTANETEAMIYMAQVEYLEETAAIVRALPLPPAQPSAVGVEIGLADMRVCLTCDGKGMVPCGMSSASEAGSPSASLSSGSQSSPPPPTTDLALSSIPAAEIEAVRKLYECVKKSGLRLAMAPEEIAAANRFLARTQSPTPAGEGEG